MMPVMLFDGMTKQEVALAAKLYAAAEELRLPTLTPKSTKADLVNWFQRIEDDFTLERGVTANDMWATVANTVVGFRAQAKEQLRKK